MKLEDLVPPLALCQRIPAGAFADSALVWVVVGDGSGGERWYLVERKNVGETKYPEIHPAPTLAEIMDALAYDFVSVYPFVAMEDIVHIGYYHHRMPHDGIRFVPECGRGRCIHKPGGFGDSVSAALKLWQELNERKAKNENY